MGTEPSHALSTDQFKQFLRSVEISARASNYDRLRNLFSGIELTDDQTRVLKGSLLIHAGQRLLGSKLNRLLEIVDTMNRL